MDYYSELLNGASNIDIDQRVHLFFRHTYLAGQFTDDTRLNFFEILGKQLREALVGYKPTTGQFHCQMKTLKFE